jgi:hypothetical protein
MLKELFKVDQLPVRAYIVHKGSVGLRGHDPNTAHRMNATVTFDSTLNVRLAHDENEHTYGWLAGHQAECCNLAQEYVDIGNVVNHRLRIC